jgi:hypothetical protein
MRRSDFDITDRIRVTDPIDVGDEVLRLYRGLYPDAKTRPMERAFRDLSAFYHGKQPDYYACDTEYHDIQHVLDVTLAMARLLDGYQRGREGGAPLPPVIFSIGVIAALFHDFGYLRRRHDHKHRFGGEYTLTHVSRGAHFLRGYLPRIGLKRYAGVASQLVHFTGYERKVESIRLSDPLLRRVGEMLGTADVIAQMADRCYLEKCRDRLYPEFVLGGLTRRKSPNGETVIIFESGIDLVRKTPGFYANATKRLDEQLHGAYRYAERHFDGRRNLYIEEMNKNVNYAKILADAPADNLLRRTPPSTLLRGLRSYPEDLVIV